MHDDADLTQQERNHLRGLERGLVEDDPAFVDKFRRDVDALERRRAERVWRNITNRLRPRH
jgi:Protein of unknown function (DUF3040)